MAYEPKTKLNDASVNKFLESVGNKQRRKDAFEICDMMAALTKEEPKMWGTSIIGFGLYHYVYESGTEGDWMLVGFSPRKTALTLYIMSGFSEYDDLMADLGKYKTGKSCLYINKLEDINIKVLKKIIRESIKYIKKKYKKT